MAAHGGFLDVGFHQLHWEDWGNRNAAHTIFHLHGGPGAGFNEQHKVLFDAEKHHVIFHDQRGSGKSTPHASIEHNTTQDLVEDIERLRVECGVETMILTGGSWGSTLALMYALTYPERVERMVLWGLFLGSQFEIDFVSEGYPRFFFPEAWNRFISFVPEEHRKSGDAIMRYYAEHIRASDELIAKQYADEWTLWEATLLSLNYDKDTLEREVLSDPSNRAIAMLETHYFLHHCFLPENHILNSLTQIQHIPATLIQGRFDMCTPPVSAYNFSQAYGSNLSVQFVVSGHLRTEPEMLAALQREISRFA